jgi:hypothetical protein
MQEKMVNSVRRKECPFEPSINRISDYLMEANPDRILETETEKWNRLSKLDAERKQLLKLEINRAHYDKISFRPKIDNISKAIGKRTKVADMADNSEAILHKKLIKEELEKKKLKECSFKPRINKKKKFKKV